MTITINNHTFTYGPSAWGGTYFSDGQNVNISTKENPTPEEARIFIEANWGWLLEGKREASFDWKFSDPIGRDALAIGQKVRNSGVIATVIGFHEITGDSILYAEGIGKWLADAEKCERIKDTVCHKNGLVIFD
ncbi:MAG TPA: hypothetical protein PLN48_07550 [Lachnospiraceae bacterium]|jgi:hypothetical protein|nr:hypothetical protein [Lachnospiraceae bacterium]